MQPCNFAVNKGKNCDVIASRVVALVVPIVILLLIAAIFPIYCFKKKADKAEEANQEIQDRLPNNFQGDFGYHNNFQGYSGYQWGGTNCTAGVTNFEKFTDRESDYESSLNSGHEPDLVSCSVSE